MSFGYLKFQTSNQRSNENVKQIFVYINSEVRGMAFSNSFTNSTETYYETKCQVTVC